MTKITGGMVVRLLKTSESETMTKKGLKKALASLKQELNKASLKQEFKEALRHLIAKGRVSKVGSRITLVRQRKKRKDLSEIDGTRIVEQTVKASAEKRQRTVAPSDNPDRITRVFLGNLHFEIDEERLRKEIPNMTHLKWLTDRKKGTSCGTAFVELATPEDATVAVATSGKIIMNRALKANFAPARPGDLWPPKKAVSYAGGATQDEEVQRTADKDSVASTETCTRVFLGNLSFKITEEKLCQALPGLKFVKWITDKETQQFYGSAFAEFSTLENAMAAVNRAGSNILGRPLKANFAPARPGDIWPPPEHSASAGGGADVCQKPSEKPSEDCRTLFMGNLSYRITDGALASFFEDCGKIADVRWLTYQDTGNFKGVAYVEFHDSAVADKAIMQNGQLLCGRPVRMDWDASGRATRSGANAEGW